MSSTSRHNDLPLMLEGIILANMTTYDKKLRVLKRGN